MEYDLQPDVRVKVAWRLKRVLRSQPTSKVSPVALARLKPWLKEASQKNSLSLNMGSLNAAKDEMIQVGAMTSKLLEAIVRDCDPAS